MKRIAGDSDVAIQLEATRLLIGEALDALKATTALDHADRCIAATEILTRASFVFGRTISGLEAVTEIPWGALGLGADWPASDEKAPPLTDFRSFFSEAHGPFPCKVGTPYVDAFALLASTFANYADEIRKRSGC